MRDNLLEKNLENVFERRVHNIREAKTLDYYAVDVSKYTLLPEKEEKQLGKKINRTLKRLLLISAKNPSLLNDLEELIFKHLLSLDLETIYPDTKKGMKPLLENLLLTLFDTYRVKLEVGEITEKAVDNLIHNIVFILLGIGFSRNSVIELLDNMNAENFTEKQRKDITALRQKYLNYRNQLVESNLRLVFLAAKKAQTRGTPLEEIIQHGNLGLIKAAERFDFNRGYRFSTYAYWCILNSIRLALQKTSHLISRPPYLQAHQGLVEQARLKFKQMHGRAANVNELADLTGLEVPAIERILLLPGDPLTLSTPINDSVDLTLEDTLQDENNPISQFWYEKQGQKLLNQLYKHITPREKLILEMRFGIGFQKEYTLHEIGIQLGLSFERVRQLQKQALEKLSSVKLDT